jgi:hypothetical protein
VSWTDEGNDLVADAWLSAELVRVWLLVEQCFRRFQKAQLRPQPDHPSVAEIEGIFTAQRRARRVADPRRPDFEEIGQALAVATDRANSYRPRSPLGLLATSLDLTPTEVELVVLCLAPQIDPPIAEVYTLIRGSSRRGVDLALLATLHRMTRPERIGLLDVLDPERPLLAWGLVQALPSDAPGASGSMMFRSILPHFDLVSAMARRPLPRGLKGICRFLPPTQSAERLDPVAAESLSGYNELVDAASHGGRFGDVAWLLVTGGDEPERRKLVATVGQHAGRPVLAFDPGRVERTELDEVFRRVQREALLRGALLYVGPLPSGRAILRRLGGYPGLVLLGQDTGRPPPTLALDRAMWSIDLSPTLRVVQ